MLKIIWVSSTSVPATHEITTEERLKNQRVEEEITHFITLLFFLISLLRELSFQEAVEGKIITKFSSSISHHEIHLTFNASVNLQIEIDTKYVLQCHPFPNEYVDASKSCSHYAFFMGLQRQPGVKVEENQQFDIRGIVECFKQDVMRYAHWRPGMDIFVSHVRRRELPSYIFPKVYNRRQRQLRHAPPSSGDTTPSSERRSKRRHDDASVADSGPGKLKKQTSVSSESTVPVIQDLASESPIAQNVVMESEDGSNTEPMQTPASIRLSLESTA